MATKLRRLGDQVIVITGASSGIGLATAKTAAQRGAKVVLAARSEGALRIIESEIRNAGGEALAVGCDITEQAQVDRVAEQAIDRYGRIDTWVNNAPQGVYGRLELVSDEDARRLFDVNFWGLVYGCQAALPHLKRNGGALINIGSEVSDAYAPLLGMYVATKHAVKGYTDVLRLEVEDLGKHPVSITLIQPTAVNTPFPQHARNLMDQEPKLPDPMIDPQDVADAILEAAEHPTRDRKVGMMAVVNATVAQLAPSVADHFAAGKAEHQQRDEPPRQPAGTLYQSSEAIQLAGMTHGRGD